MLACIYLVRSMLFNYTSRIFIITLSKRIGFITVSTPAKANNPNNQGLASLTILMPLPYNTLHGTGLKQHATKN